ncbi:hypothetical protein EJ05DRAFT_90161 [Pseudovirgaria hyperparasitica]|uniref:FAD-binding FR-type domain-containing protein n=1 Tax=Pseudovirgaria hyperparasitica TaxID=470096 RepID=A0A6A6W3C5_9PEZI|nr:uncharacterized protein EJ05DRAFT_90161 [Pseudovirgaria hyperparasitica]KAF2756097.1 hypothetical protein EJ05DRAFT_90161 [Pseudovirgaria hyperparasitica]
MTSHAFDGVVFLKDEEVDEFVKSLDKNSDGIIDYSELERKLDHIHDEIVPKPLSHHLNHGDRDEQDRHDFLRSIIGSDKNAIPVAEFKNIVRSWNVPSLEQDKEAAKEEDNYLKRMSWYRRFRVWWAVEGPEYLTLILVVSIQVGLGVWQMVKYITQTQYRDALGWGVVLAKTCAGSLYGTMFFLLLSMSRYFTTSMRKSQTISRFANWDLSQSFHIKISIAAIALATLHAIGHLTGSFVFGSRTNRQEAVAVLLGPDAVPKAYIDYVRSTPGWTGLTALGCFYLLALLSMPVIRKWNYEVFQLGHLLMFPIIGLLAAHGSTQLLQWTMLGYFLAFPAILIVFERLLRIVQGFHRISATLQVLDKETVAVTVHIPKYRIWPYKAGQYVFLQVPSISLFQWHPFTISTCHENVMQVHVKNDGDWTGKLHGFAQVGESKPIRVGIDGPFGAPAQRFPDFDFSMVFGAGIGVTPFSGILTDLQQQEEEERTRLETKAAARKEQATSEGIPDSQLRQLPTNTSIASHFARFRRIDFHWLVRDRNNLLWFAELLNTVTRAQREEEHSPTIKNLDINIVTHVTQKRKDISEHVFRWLLEMHRTDEHPCSPITGLLNNTHFGRPDLGRIMTSHYEDMKVLRKEKSWRLNGLKKDDSEELKVGVFFCGPPVIGYQLADWCWRLTARGREEGCKVEYYFMMEVFG